LGKAQLTVGVLPYVLAKARLTVDDSPMLWRKLDCSFMHAFIAKGYKGKGDTIVKHLILQRTTAGFGPALPSLVSAVLTVLVAVS
jgi:hypothetical protein